MNFSLVKFIPEVFDPAIIADDFDLMPLFYQVFGHLPGPGRMPGTFAGNAIYNFCYHSPYEISFSVGVRNQPNLPRIRKASAVTTHMVAPADAP